MSAPTASASTQPIHDVDPKSIVPSSIRALRACIPCKMIKSSDQFYQYGCENCPHLEMQGDRAKVDECTSSSFEGMIIITDPSDAKQQLAAAGDDGTQKSSGKASWVARWQGLDRFVRGVYAIHVFGQFGEMEDAGAGQDEDDYQ